MAVADLYNVPRTDIEFKAWTFYHMAHHRDVNRAIRQQYGIVLPEYALDPAEITDQGVWSYQHQIMHNNNDAILKVVAGYDLSYVDWTNPLARGGWIYLNANLHYLEAQACGLW